MAMERFKSIVSKTVVQDVDPNPNWSRIEQDVNHPDRAWEPYEPSNWGRYDCYDVVRNQTLRETIGSESFSKAIEAMRSKGYTAMSLFLEMHPIVLNMLEHRCWGSRDITVFAPYDKAVAGVRGELSPVLLRHVTGMGFRNKKFSRMFLPEFVVTLTEHWPDGLEMINHEVPLHTTRVLYQADKDYFSVFGLPQILPPLTAQSHWH